MRQRLALIVVMLGVAMPSPARAVEVFASPDEARTTEDCLTEATACALGKALTVWDPPTPFPPVLPLPKPPAPGEQVLTLLPGTYTATDLVAAGGPFPANNLDVPRGAILRGKPGAERPVLAIGDPGFSDPTIEVTSGGVVRDLVIDATSFLGIDARGLDATLSSIGTIPATIERVRLFSKARPAESESYGVSLSSNAIAANIDIDHTAAQGAALALSLQSPSFAGPKAVGITATSVSAAALSATGGGEGLATPLRATVANSILRGNTTDVVAQSSFFSSSPPPGTPTPIELTLRNNAIRAAARSLLGPGTVTLIESGTVDSAELGLDGDGIPTAGSPLVDRGLTDPDLGSADVLGAARAVGAAPDIGAYERQTALPAAPTPTPTPTPPGNGSAPLAGVEPRPGAAPALDVTAPAVAFTGKARGLKRRALRATKGAVITATINEAITGGKLELLTRTSRRGRTTERILVSAAIAATPAGPLAIALKGKTSKLGAGKRNAILRLTVVDAAGNATTIERTITLS